MPGPGTERFSGSYTERPKSSGTGPAGRTFLSERRSGFAVVGAISKGVGQLLLEPQAFGERQGETPADRHEGRLNSSGRERDD
jgi:hypothetical protein